MKERPYLYCDLDNTLIAANVVENTEKVIIYKRPGAEEFLSKLKKIGNVILLTCSERKYAKESLRVTGLNRFFKHILSREDLSKVIPRIGPAIAPPGIMFDDYPVGSLVYDLKATAIGTYGHPSLWIQVERFSLEHPDRNGLKKAFVELHERMLEDRIKEIECGSRTDL